MAMGFILQGDENVLSQVVADPIMTITKHIQLYTLVNCVVLELYLNKDILKIKK